MKSLSRVQLFATPSELVCTRITQTSRYIRAHHSDAAGLVSAHHSQVKSQEIESCNKSEVFGFSVHVTGLHSTVVSQVLMALFLKKCIYIKKTLDC